MKTQTLYNAAFVLNNSGSYTEGKMNSTVNGFVSVNNNCIGCGRCMLECPGQETNISVYENGVRRLSVNNMNCISCGDCFNVCKHDAREYEDDTEAFLDALGSGERLPLIVSTDLYTTYGERAYNILGYLRSLGVKNIYNSGYGADLFVYMSARYLKEYSGEIIERPFILNSCPTVLNYIQRYEPEAVKLIVPVQSPPLCTAIYARKYLGDTSRFVYLSSCIARKAEFSHDRSDVKIDFTVTHKHFMEHIGKVDLSGYRTEPDLEAVVFGDIISAGGGLKDYMSSLFSDDELIVSYHKLNKRTRGLLASVKDENVPRPFMVSIAGCEYGCISGAGADRSASENYREYLGALQGLRRTSMMKKRNYASYWELYSSIGEKFSNLDPADFMVELENRFVPFRDIPEDVIDDIFRRMHMTREEQRQIDCRNCGYNTCRELAVAVAKGYARIEDCSRYVTEEFRRKLFFDDLTGLLSSQGFHVEASELVRKNIEKKYVLCAGNVNGIKTINDLYNFNVGSQAIVYIANILSDVVSGRGICARLGGNNFVLLMENNEENLRRLTAIRYFDCGDLGINMPVTMRFGLCEVSGKGDIKRFTNCASFAMEKNDDRSYNSFMWYDEKMRAEISVEAAITSQMRKAMYDNEFTMYLQPQYSHSTGELVGAETLCRWVKQDGTVVSPGVFIPIFEKNGFIKKLDRFMWESAFRQICKWTEEGLTPVPISVNISRMSLVDDEIVGVISDLQEKYGIDQKLLHFEITESAYSKDQDALIRRIGKIRELGFLIAMDDFGSGYSSLNTLKDIPIDILKLDMGFLRGNSNREKGGSIIGSVIRMAHSLGLWTIAEGVETLDQADFLKSVGCDVIQGYLYARPMPVPKYEELMSNSTKNLRNSESAAGDIPIRLFGSDSAGNRLFESYLGAAAVFEYNMGRLWIVRINDALIDILGYSGVAPVEFSSTFDRNITDTDRIYVAEAIRRSISGEEGSPCVFGYTRPDGRHIILKARIWYLGTNGENPIIYTLTDDVTDVMNYRKV